MTTTKRQMHEVTRAMWRAGMTQKRWCQRNKVSQRYLQSILGGYRGFYQAGEAERIFELLKDQFGWSPAEKENAA